MSEREVWTASNGTLYWVLPSGGYKVMSRQEAEAYRNRQMSEYQIPEMDRGKYCENYIRGTGVYPQFCHGTDHQVYVKKSRSHSFEPIGIYQDLLDKQNEEQKEPEMADVFKVLTTVVIVSSVEFAKLPPAKQTEVLVTASGKPIVFVAHFNELRNRKAIIKKLLGGEDVTVELEFNDIELTDDEKKTVQDVQPVLKKFDALKPTYPFVEVTEALQDKIDQIKIEDKRISNVSGYYVTIEQAKKLWSRVAPYWAGDKKPQSTYYTLGGHSDRHVTFSKEQIVAGCQTITRAEMEYVAQKLGWDFPEVKEA